MSSAINPNRDAAGTWMSCRPGQVIASEYEIKSLLGYGGVGEVYLTRHRTLKADFAVKVLLPRLRSREDVKARFRQESRALWELSHPSFVQVHHAGDDAEIGPYIAMEVLEGRTLASLGKMHTPSFDDAMALGIEIAEAAEVMHAVGIIHRDLKPENIFIAFGKRPRGETKGPRPRSVKLLDLGAAKIAHSDKPPTEDLHTVGTGRYMSPEHVRCEPLTPASDVYALAHILYEFVSREHPFEGAPKVPSHVEFLLLHRDAAQRALHETKRGAPRPLSDVVAQAMAKSPRDRFQSMAAFAQALREARRLLKIEQSVGKTEKITQVSDPLATIEDALLEATHHDPSPNARPRVATLLERDASGATREHALAYGEHLIGRGGVAEVQLPDASVSTRHARVSLHTTGIVELFDEGSAQGTIVNGKRVAYAMLAHGDRVRFGAVECELRVEGARSREDGDARDAPRASRPADGETAPTVVPAHVEAMQAEVTRAPGTERMGSAPSGPPAALASSSAAPRAPSAPPARSVVAVSASALERATADAALRPPAQRGGALMRWVLVFGVALAVCIGVVLAVWFVVRRP